MTATMFHFVILCHLLRMPQYCKNGYPVDDGSHSKKMVEQLAFNEMWHYALGIAEATDAAYSFQYR